MKNEEKVMGTLARKIEQSFLDSVGGEKNPTTQKLGEEIESHIAEFLTKQPFTIKKMKARDEIEKLFAPTPGGPAPCVINGTTPIQTETQIIKGDLEKILSNKVYLES